jgi:hypothetical protein
MYGTAFPVPAETFPEVPDFPFDGSPPTEPLLRTGTGTPGVNTTIQGWVPWPAGGPTPLEQLEAKTAEYNGSKDQFNAQLAAEQPDGNALIERFATLSAEHGDVEYMGDQGHALDVDTLVELIAGHFGFDPATGADLG